MIEGIFIFPCYKLPLKHMAIYDRLKFLCLQVARTLGLGSGPSDLPKLDSLSPLEPYNFKRDYGKELAVLFGSLCRK